MQLAISDLYTDIIQPFMIDHTTIRGRLVRLNNVLNEILNAHNYPLAVSYHLAEQIVIAALLSATLDNNGILTVQTKGEKAVKFMVVDVMGNGDVRGYANIDTEQLPSLKNKKKKMPIEALMGKGYLAVTLDEGGSKERYQGIVELAETSLTDSFRGYFLQSYQAEIATHIVVKAPENTSEKWQAGGIIIERMPIEGGKELAITAEENDEIWQRSQIFMKTLKDSEMLNPEITPQNLLYRLFSEDGVWVYKLQHLKAGCRCSRQRVLAALKTIPKQDLIDSLTDGKMSVSCQFCNKKEVFTTSDINRLFTKRKKAK